MTNNIGHFVIAHSSHDAEPGEHGTFDSPLTSAAQKAVRRVLRAAGGGKELITGEGWEVRDDGSVILIRDSGGSPGARGLSQRVSGPGTGSRLHWSHRDHEDVAGHRRSWGGGHE